MTIIHFLKTYSTLPEKFIDDFAEIVFTDKHYDTTRVNIDFDLVTKWLDIKKSNLKRLLVSKFEEGIDYTIEKLVVPRENIRTGAVVKERILMNPSTFKHLCMLSRTAKADHVRLYFLEMERLIIKYHNEIVNGLAAKITALETNQKPKIDLSGGVMYVLDAQNNVDSINSVFKFTQKSDHDVKKLYKVGKTQDIKKRLQTYNTGNANDVVPVYITEIKHNIDGVEKCVKVLCESVQYRKKKEIYQITLDVLKNVILNCEKGVDIIRTMSRNNIYVGELDPDVDYDQHRFHVIFTKYTDIYNENEHNKAKTKTTTKAKSKSKEKSKSKSKLNQRGGSKYGKLYYENKQTYKLLMSLDKSNLDLKDRSNSNNLLHNF